VKKTKKNGREKKKKHKKKKKTIKSCAFRNSHAREDTEGRCGNKSISKIQFKQLQQGLERRPQGVSKKQR